MTSSLVGSEMCIRDRAFDCLNQCPCLVSLLREQPDIHGLLHSTTCEPVSYTHLTLPTICSV
eukprot:1234346-Prorocentrum_lima.AAC.1